MTAGAITLNATASATIAGSGVIVSSGDLTIAVNASHEPDVDLGGRVLPPASTTATLTIAAGALVRAATWC